MIKAILNDCEQDRRLAEINWTVVEILINFLFAFQDITYILQYDSYPTTYEVY